MIMTHTPARRGDLAALVRQSVTYYQGRGNVLSVTVSLGTVASITRDGIVKRLVIPFTPDGTTEWTRDRSRADDQILVAPRDRVDADAALAAYRERRYPNADSAMVPPFYSLTDARQFLSQWKR